MTPTEDPKDKANRLRERRLTEIERTKSAEASSASLSSDLRAIYGMKQVGR